VNPVPKLEEEEEEELLGHSRYPANNLVVRTRLEGAPESLYCVGRCCISWQLVPVSDGFGEERISEGLTARSFLIKAILEEEEELLGHSRYPANNLVCIRPINRTTFHMSVT
jgi:hypothetical protein